MFSCLSSLCRRLLSKKGCLATVAMGCTNRVGTPSKNDQHDKIHQRTKFHAFIIFWFCYIRLDGWLLRKNMLPSNRCYGMYDSHWHFH